MRVVILNGVNLDVLPKRAPEVYGGISHDELETQIYRWAEQLGISVQVRQTNHEGQFVEWCHSAADWADGVIVNAAAWTHYSYAIHDALQLLSVPLVEVHLSDVDRREEWRRLSVISDLAAKRIIGKGPEGYREALEFLAQSS
jgi:3-dehydroquinate dehydratase-2